MNKEINFDEQEEICKCDFCNVEIGWESTSHRGSIWECEECNTLVCSSCIEEAGGSTSAEARMILCPNCLNKVIVNDMIKTIGNLGWKSSYLEKEFQQDSDYSLEIEKSISSSKKNIFKIIFDGTALNLLQKIKEIENTDEFHTMLAQLHTELTLVFNDYIPNSLNIVY